MKQYLRDEEQAYILYLKYVEMNKNAIARENQVFKMNQKYFTSMYDNRKNIDAAKEALVTLGESLNSRYKVKHQEDTSTMRFQIW